ncbi:MAG: hypothetical protein ACOC1K_05335 [Nanoarchaeota archaeon]
MKPKLKRGDLVILRNGNEYFVVGNEDITLMVNIITKEVFYYSSFYDNIEQVWRAAEDAPLSYYGVLKELVYDRDWEEQNE